MSGFKPLLLSIFFSIFALQLAIANEHSLKVEWPALTFQNIPKEIVIELHELQLTEKQSIPVFVNGNLQEVIFYNGKGALELSFDKKQSCTIEVLGAKFTGDVNPVPLWMSVLPPLLAIIIALVFREVFVALFAGLFVGSAIMTYYSGYSLFGAIFYGLFAIGDVYIIESLNDSAHLSIIVFSMMIGAMVTLISDNGGMKGVVNKLAKYANSPRSGQFVAWLLGMAIFFDDYANTLVVGNTMRPVADRLKISREKLSYIVDSTAAPIASIAFVTTWIGAELSYIQDGVSTLGLSESAYDIFINSLQYSFYPVLALLFILIIVFMKRDFGPMLHAERYVKTQGIRKIHPGVKKTESDKNTGKERWFNAAIPVLVVVVATVSGLVSTGLQQTSWDTSLGITKNISSIIGHSDSYRALLWSSLAGILVAVMLTISQRLMTLKESVESLISGFKTMVTAILILALAWSIALVTKYMHTADFISGVLVELNLAPFFVPAITFLLAAFVAFSTGSSWGTMAILYPLVLPSSWLLAQEAGLDYDQSLAIFHNVVSTVLAGSVLGDHCSPISDTTILSSLASSCNHIEHVRTQLPYALVVGAVGTLLGTLPAAWGVPSYILFPLCLIVLYLVVRFFGKKVDANSIVVP